MTPLATVTDQRILAERLAEAMRSSGLPAFVGVAPAPDTVARSHDILEALRPPARRNAR